MRTRNSGFYQHKIFNFITALFGRVAEEETSTIIAFDVLNVVGLVLTTIALLPALLSPTVSRTSTWIALLVSSIFYSFSYLLLLPIGQRSVAQPAYGMVSRTPMGKFRINVTVGATYPDTVTIDSTRLHISRNWIKLRAFAWYKLGRIIVFTIFPFGAFALNIAGLFSSGTTNDKWNLLLPILPLGAAIIFGSRTDILSAWKFWNSAHKREALWNIYEEAKPEYRDCNCPHCGKKVESSGTETV
ncbi:hypothetical protein D9757_010981 [Collybiopsis confluens]|uniref:Uncharacterized protein n=1 Tax=Collybiopsis confluens TaxID=2823264 RepID=A0A8H5GMD2_9AGAR|nr:hypothetical protein D9757_010981 [Collybiopsis confluens]